MSFSLYFADYPFFLNLLSLPAYYPLVFNHISLNNIFLLLFLYILIYYISFHVYMIICLFLFFIFLFFGFFAERNKMCFFFYILNINFWSSFLSLYKFKYLCFDTRRGFHVKAAVSFVLFSAPFFEDSWLSYGLSSNVNQMIGPQQDPQWEYHET